LKKYLFLANVPDLPFGNSTPSTSRAAFWKKYRFLAKAPELLFGKSTAFLFWRTPSSPTPPTYFLEKVRRQPPRAAFWKKHRFLANAPELFFGKSTVPSYFLEKVPLSRQRPRATF
jgi:hypothetical protein